MMSIRRTINTEEERENIREQIPSGRLGTTDDVAKFLVSILKSDSYMTGQVITFDGGWT